MVESTVRNFFGNLFGASTAEDKYDEEPDMYEDGEYIEDEEPDTEGFSMFKRKARVVAMPQPQQIKMKISKPTNFDQVEEIIGELKVKNSVVINLEYVSKDIARRIMDAVSGAASALDGHVEKVSNSIFVVARFIYANTFGYREEKVF